MCHSAFIGFQILSQLQWSYWFGNSLQKENLQRIKKTFILTSLISFMYYFELIFKYLLKIQKLNNSKIYKNKVTLNDKHIRYSLKRKQTSLQNNVRCLNFMAFGLSWWYFIRHYSRIENAWKWSKTRFGQRWIKSINDIY